MLNLSLIGGDVSEAEAAFAALGFRPAAARFDALHAGRRGDDRAVNALRAGGEGGAAVARVFSSASRAWGEVHARYGKPTEIPPEFY